MTAQIIPLYPPASDLPALRFCAHCRNRLPIANFYLQLRNGRRVPRGACKSCHIKRRMAQAKAERERVERRRAMLDGDCVCGADKWAHAKGGVGSCVATGCPEFFEART